MARIILPKDIIPFRPGVAIIDEVLPDQSYGRYEKTFMEYVTSIEAPTTRTSEDLETGGDNITILQSENDNPNIVVNAFNASWHALYSGQKFEVGSSLFPVEKAIKISEVGDSTKTYSYTFPDDVEPAEDADGKTNIYLFDKNGYSLTDVSAETEAVAVGQFKYDTDTKTISVTVDYKDETMSIMFESELTDVATTTAPDLIKSNEFRLKTISYVQSPSTSQQYIVFDEWARVAPTGDVTALAKQKAVNTNMSYAFGSRKAPAGMKRHVQKIALYTAE